MTKAAIDVGLLIGGSIDADGDGTIDRAKSLSLNYFIKTYQNLNNAEVRICFKFCFFYCYRGGGGVALMKKMQRKSLPNGSCSPVIEIPINILALHIRSD